MQCEEFPMRVAETVGCVHIQTAHLWRGMTVWDPQSWWEDTQGWEEELLGMWKCKCKKRKKKPRKLNSENQRMGEGQEGEVSRGSGRERRSGKVNLLLFSVVCLSSGTASTNKTPLGDSAARGGEGWGEGKSCSAEMQSLFIWKYPPPRRQVKQRHQEDFTSADLLTSWCGFCLFMEMLWLHSIYDPVIGEARQRNSM